MEMESAVHRRIELQSPEDFTYLIDNVRRAAAESINAAFPPVDAGDRNGEDEEEEEDELRVRIEQLVDDYITKTFTYVAPNISINGLPVTDPSEFLSLSSSPLTSPSSTTATTTRSNGTNNKKSSAKSSSSSKIRKTKSKSKKPTKPQEEYEPFDPRKRSRLEALAREEEDLLRSIALLKRRVPSSAASALADSLARQTDADQKALDRAKQRVVEEGVVAGRKALEGLLPFVGGAAVAEGGNGNGNGNGSGDVTTGKGGNEKGGDAAVAAQMERQEEIEDGFAKAVEALRRLKSQMPATVARMERARVAGGYVVAGVGGSSVVAAPGEGR